jgi:hypothetical protein
MAFILKGLFNIGGSSEVAAEAQQVKKGDIAIQLDAENHQIIFTILETNVRPIVFDLNRGVILNATLAPA